MSTEWWLSVVCILAAVSYIGWGLTLLVLGYVLYPRRRDEDL